MTEAIASSFRTSVPGTEEYGYQYRRRRICTVFRQTPDWERFAEQVRNIDCCSPTYRDACFPRRPASADRFYELCCVNAVFSKRPDRDGAMDFPSKKWVDTGFFEKWDYVHNYQSSAIQETFFVLLDRILLNDVWVVLDFFRS